MYMYMYMYIYIYIYIYLAEQVQATFYEGSCCDNTNWPTQSEADPVLKEGKGEYKKQFS